MDLDINPLDHAPLLCNDSSSQQQIPALRAGCRTFSTRTMWHHRGYGHCRRNPEACHMSCAKSAETNPVREYQYQRPGTRNFLDASRKTVMQELFGTTGKKPFAETSRGMLEAFSIKLAWDRPRLCSHNGPDVALVPFAWSQSSSCIRIARTRAVILTQPAECRSSRMQNSRVWFRTSRRC